ncbi:peptide/nickel transport system substrate-binding protein [Primorskyibacter sedentarius]|uniref:Peptide/nickel transport system substrate-binding protein n=1 Tax=Primorskyibacter sedentarius TaxID=745311 RepID=A0A4R3JI30_9RHOB|nr:ABC transporter substrate-binding protein [Primorskyibacter sedentarius]TCS65664.1 peptide/nickel transport system substrate-binding protein [Primorskyibacter sedentarius]
MLTKRKWTTLASVIAIAVAGQAAAWEEAPQLAEQVAAGSLPPVDERLPAEPLLMDVIEGPGEYGGTLRRAILGGGDQHNMVRTIGSDNMVRWSPDWSEVRPNIAKSWDVSDDASKFTFHLREGMKWSDGAPFTADDIMFWYEDVFSDAALTPNKDSTFVGPVGPVKISKIDDVTVEFDFGAPNGLFLQALAYGFGYHATAYPKHYLSQFMPKYNDDVQALVEAEPTVGDWVQLFNLKAGPMDTPLFWQNPDRPTLHAWHLTNAYGATDRVIAERNPYYYKVDSQGQQLPYIDRITYDQVEDVETILLKAFNGEIDYMLRHLGRPSNKASLTDNMERGKYGFFDVGDLPANIMILMMNLNHTDPLKREVINNKDFRIGVSHAMNRQEVIDLLYFGAGTPAQTAPREGSDLYKEEYAKQYTEYDTDLANAYLDKVLPEKDADGYRLGPDGERFTMVFLVADVFGLQYPDAMELIAGYAADVGLDFQIRTTDRSRLIELHTSNDFDAYLWNCSGGQADAYLTPICYVPTISNSVSWAREWAAWGVDPSTGEEPPQEVKDIFDTYNQVRSAATPEAQKELMQKVLDMAAEQFFTIGMVQNDPVFGIARNNVRNVPNPLPIAGQLWFPAPYTAQMYFEGGTNLP